MTKFIIGLLFGLILGAAGTAFFLISAGGGDYLVVTSPRVRELEGSLKQADQERAWLRDQLRTSTEVVTKLESRFLSLATRFEDLISRAADLPAPRSDRAGTGPSGATGANGSGGGKAALPAPTTHSSERGADAEKTTASQTAEQNPVGQPRAAPSRRPESAPARPAPTSTPGWRGRPTAAAQPTAS